MQDLAISRASTCLQRDRRSRPPREIFSAVRACSLLPTKGAAYLRRCKRRGAGGHLSGDASVHPCLLAVGPANDSCWPSCAAHMVLLPFCSCSARSESRTRLAQTPRPVWILPCRSKRNLSTGRRRDARAVPDQGWPMKRRGPRRRADGGSAGGRRSSRCSRRDAHAQVRAHRARTR